MSLLHWLSAFLKAQVWLRQRLLGCIRLGCGMAWKFKVEVWVHVELYSTSIATQCANSSILLLDEKPLSSLLFGARVHQLNELTVLNLLWWKNVENMV